MSERAAALERLRAGRFDLLVVGGGIIGAGVAEVASRHGLNVAVVERDDFASGTSSASSKLVHGGLRYLRLGHFSLVREALAEVHALSRYRRAPSRRGRSSSCSRSTAAARTAVIPSAGRSGRTRD